MPLDIESVLDQLTLAEKAALTSGSGFWFTEPVERLGVPRIVVSDGPHGLRAQPPGAGDHLGLGTSVPATCFPTASAIASTWNPGLLHRIGEALAQEARAAKLSVILGPGINMKRSPLCGRNFEYFSEDPYLAGELAVGIIDGIQSRGDVGTSLKHYAANNQENDRLRVDARVSERALREIYLPAFERAVQASQPWTIMCAYNKVNGESASQNTWLLDTVLRNEFGFEGLVVSDWGAVYDVVKALQAGTDLEMPPSEVSTPAIIAAVESGELDEAVLDQRVRTVLELVSKGMGILDAEETFDADAHHTLARAAAGESAVLLKNDGPLLPLAAEVKVAVIGELARTPRFQGAGSSQVNPTRIETALDELCVSYPGLAFSAGFALEDADSEAATARAKALIEAAAATAAAADVAVVFIGLPHSYESEGFDRTHIDLPPAQLECLAAVAAANPNVVTVLVNGATVDLSEVIPHSTALLEAWLGGQAAGGGITDVLTGAVNPSGRLAETFPVRLENNSSYLNFPGDSQIVNYGEGIFIGYRGYDKANQEVAYPFGFGLSYTTFEISDAQVTTAGSVEGEDLSATVTTTVTNTGSRAGAHVVQVYVRDIESEVSRPVRELKGFAKVYLEPGDAAQVSIDLDQRAFSFWSDKLERWAVEAGEFAIEVAHDSRQIADSVTVRIDAPRLALPLTADSVLHEWHLDPDGRAIIGELVARGAADPLADEFLIKLLGTMPMTTLANFAGMSLTHAEIHEAVTLWKERTGGA